MVADGLFSSALQTLPMQHSFMAQLTSKCIPAAALVKDRRIVFVRAKNQTARLRTDGATSALSMTQAKSSKAKTAAVVDELDIKRILDWEKSRKIGPGFSNLGNTCYLNAVLQCLSYTPCFVQYLLRNRKMYSNAKNEHRFCAMQAMLQLLEHIHSESNALKNGPSNAFYHMKHMKVIQPREFVVNVRNLSKHFRIGRQEDAHEFFRSLLDSMQKSCLRRANISSEMHPMASTTLIPRIFGGKLKNTLKCSKCRHISERLDDFQDLSLGIHNGIKSVQEALQHFTTVEILDERNAWKCSKCKQMNQAEKGLSIEMYPNVFVIQLKRFDGFCGKIKKHIDFPMILDLPRGHSRDHKKEVTKLHRSTDKNHRYSLYGVLVHAGHSTDCGHYYAFVKGSSGQWYEMNDDCVQWVSADTVLSQRAYMLFYSRILSKEENSAASSDVIQKLASTADSDVKDIASQSIEKIVTAAQRPPHQSVQVQKLCTEAVIPRQETEKLKSLVRSDAKLAVKAEQLVTYHITQQVMYDASVATKSGLLPVFSGQIGRRNRNWKRSLPLELQIEYSGTEPIKIDSLDARAQTTDFVKPISYKDTADGSNAALYGKDVGMWDGLDELQSVIESNTEKDKLPISTENDTVKSHNSILQQLRREDKERWRKRRQTSWNAALDKGKVKKLRHKIEFKPNQGTSSSFQRAFLQKKEARISGLDLRSIGRSMRKLE